jgi:hypothetical protein
LISVAGVRMMDGSPMEAYFSHSYRDVAINSYFLEHFVDEEIPLRADQKTDIWCVAKLERYLSDTTGFVSIIPERTADGDRGGYSPYIGEELTLARRARLPRLLFVDQNVLTSHEIDFPEDAVPFDAANPASREQIHIEAIRLFGRRLETADRPSREAGRKEATVVAGDGAGVREAAADVAELLRRDEFRVTLESGRHAGRGLEDIRLLETLWRAELCAFVLGPRLSDGHIALAMAHAHGIPSVRMQYDPHAADCTPSVTGLIRWRSRDEMLVEFARQLRSYLGGLVSPVELARDSNASNAARSIGTMRWQPRADNEWDITDRTALIRHVHPDHAFVREEVARARTQVDRALGRMRGREGGMEVCTILYDGLRRHRLGYEFESVTGSAGVQAIRTPTQIAAHRTATCIDLVCLFASLLEAAGQNAVIVVLDSPGFAHALAGYRVLGEPAWPNGGIGDLRGAVARGDCVLFEATGAVEADEPVGAETAEERSTKVLGFMDAVAAGKRMLDRPDILLKHFVDVRGCRAEE